MHGSLRLNGNGGGYIPMIVENKIRQIGNLAEKEGGRRNPSCGRVYDTGGISPALNTMQGGGREPHIVAMRGRNPERGRMGLKQSRDWR